ncbi:MAG: ATP synthase F1 subunit delta [Myxococcales bacterium]|nr:ATP synthase F1 subunit delta [Myxococcales bacterium]
MSISVVGKRYASALLQLATEAKAVDRIGKDLSDFAASWKEAKDLRSVFENPGVSQSQRRAVLTDLARAATMHQYTRDTLMLLADRRRMRHVPEVAEAYQALSEARSGRVRAEVVSAAELPAGYYRELERTLREVTGKEVVLERSTDPSLIGGVVTRVGDQVFDGSIKNRLAELSDELLR